VKSSFARAALLALLILPMVGAVPAAAAEEEPPTGAQRGDDTLSDLVEAPTGLRLQSAIQVPFADAYDADPMGLVAYRSITSLLTSGTESWDVYLCTSDDEDKPSAGLVMADVAAALNAGITPYFSTISQGRYTPTFRAGTESGGVFDESEGECGVARGHSGSTPRIYVKDWSLGNQGGVAGLGGPGLISYDGTGLGYSGDQRRIEVTADAVTTTTGWAFSPAGSITAHELGHSIFWAHAGATTDYDNNLDVMSNGWGGTHVFNLYSAGWMAPEQVALHHGGDRTYTLGAVGHAGQRMIVLTTGTEGLFYVLGMRTPGDPNLDAGTPPVVPEPGIEVYRVDQRPGQCGGEGLPARSPCLGLYADVTPYPAAVAQTYPYGHFHEAGTSFTIDGVPVTVAAGAGATLEVRVAAGLTPHGIFLDDDPSVFEQDIEWVAAADITRGCNPPRGDEFCPRETVTRGQMAAFLVRTLGLPAATTDHFSDDDSSVFEQDINALAQSGITRGCSATAYCPDATITREQMAAFLVRAYGLGGTTLDTFGDDDGTTFENEINALAASGITRGCSTSSFCGRDTVTREQMAAFLRRAETR
jgi:hypothetical protein